MIATTNRTLCVLGILAWLAVIPTPVDAALQARTDFRSDPLEEAWGYRVGYPDGIAGGDQITGPRRDDGRWVLRAGPATSQVDFDPVELRGTSGRTLSFVFRVERARWKEDAFAEMLAVGPGDETRRLWRWGAAEFREAKPGRGNFQHVALPEDFEVLSLRLVARASVSRGSGWFDLWNLRVDAIPMEAPEGTSPAWDRPPYLQWAGANTALLRWRTHYPRRATVRFAPADGQGAPVRWEATAAAVDHSAPLVDLRPDTLYRYEIDLDGEPAARGESYAFRTPPRGRALPDAGSVGIWVIGDSGKCSVSPTGCTESAAVRDAMAARSAERPPAMWLLLGDNAYPHGTDWQYSEALFRHYARRAASTLLWPVAGNHDFYAADARTQSGVYFDSFDPPSEGEAGGVPSGTEAYYSFDWGPLHIVVLDSHDSDRSADGPMARWLEADLASAADARWTLAAFHHPPYSHGSHDSDDPEDSGGRMQDMREVFVPILERHNVDLVLAGHSHGYERSALIRGHTGHSSSYQETTHRAADGDGSPPRGYSKGEGESAGTVYVVVGSSSEASHRMRPHPVMVRSLPELGSLWIEARRDSLRARFVGATGEILDDFALRKDPAPQTPGMLPLVVSTLILAGAAAAALWAGRRRQSA